MATIRKVAEYTERENITEFIGNPLIAALPESVEQKALLNGLMKLPPFREEERSLSSRDRLDLLSRINAIHIPYVHDLFIARNISRCISWGYVSRNPMPFATTAEVLQKYRGDVTPELENYLTGAEFPIYGFSILGISGVGKSCSVLNALKRYPKVIDHTEYNGVPFHAAQLVWLKVDCPGDGTPKGLCTAILKAMDASLGTSYQSEVTKRISKDVLTTKVSQCLCSHHLGILVIDDIQNLCGVKKDTTSDMMSFLIYLMETLAIPVVMVGTPKVLPLFQQEFQLAKRATGDGTVRIELLPKDSNEWDRFIGGIWNYQFTRNPVPLTDEMKETFYKESVGNPFLCSLIYKLVQDDAITSGQESFSIQDIKKVASEKLCITSIMRSNMLNGRDEELKKYECLWNAAELQIDFSYKKTKKPQKTDKIDELITYIATELVKSYGIGLKQATTLAKNAVASKGTDNREETLGFAAEMCQSMLSKKARTRKKKDVQSKDPGPVSGAEQNV